MTSATAGYSHCASCCVQQQTNTACADSIHSIAASAVSSKISKYFIFSYFILTSSSSRAEMRVGT